MKLEEESMDTPDIKPLIKQKLERIIYMKRILCIVLSIIMVMGLVACGDTQKPTKQETVPTTEIETSAEPAVTTPSETEPPVTEPVETEPVIEETEPILVPASGSPFEKASFTIQGTTFQLGDTAEKILQNTTYVTQYDLSKRMIEPQESARVLFVGPEPWSDLCTVAYNQSDEAMNILQCPLIYVQLTPFVTSNGISSRSSLEDVVAVFGKDCQKRQWEGQTIVEWAFEENGVITTVRYIPKQNKPREASSIYLEYVAYDKHPYYAKEQLPFSIDGVQYKVRDPIKSLCENMTIVEDSDKVLVEPDGYVSMSLQDKNGNIYSITAKNFTDETVDYLSCSLTYLYVQRGRVNTLTLLDTITFDSTDEEAATVMKELNGHFYALEPDNYEGRVSLSRRDATKPYDQRQIDIIVINAG